jgi:mannitol 2-dehydrogenase
MASSAQKLCAGNLESLCAANSAIAKPKYERSKITAGIVHIGVGNFHRAHQCVFADDVLSLLGHETWGYKGIGLMPFDSKMQAVMKEQDCLYTLWQKGADRSEQVRVVGCHSDFILAPEDPELALSALSAVTTKIVTLTVTEKGYFVNLGTGQLDIHEPMVAHDIDLLKNTPATCTPFKTAAGYLVSAIRRRIAEGTGGFAILSCDNVQENGRKAQMAVLQLAEAVDASVATWIREHVTFPNSMVDRITPATTDEAKAELTLIQSMALSMHGP